MIVTEESRTAIRDLPEERGVAAEALIKEARQRQHRRWLVVIAVVLTVGLASGIWAASNGRSTTKPPAPSKATQVKTAGLSGSTGSRHANPLSLVGTWRVIGSGQRRAPLASIGSLGLVVWTTCGWMSGEWNADRQGLFAGILSGGVPACAFSYANLN